MRIKKRIISLMLALVLCCTMALPAFASVTPKADVSIEEMFNEAVLTASTKLSGRGADNASCYVTLTSDDGSAFDVAVYEYTPATTRSTDTGEISKTFVYSVQSEYVTPRAYGSTLSGTGWDDSYSVYGYITIVYNSQPYNSTGIYEYLLTSVYGGWDRSDSTVSLSNRYVAYTCQSVFHQDQVTQQEPTSNTFNYSTGYDDYVADDSSTAVLGATSSVTLKHGSASSWTLSTSANLFVNDIADFI